MKKILSILCAALLAASCHFLDEQPKDQTDESRIVSDVRSLYLATLGDLYARFGSDQSGEGIAGTDRGSYDTQTFTTDEAMIPTRGADWYDGGLWERLFKHEWETGEAPFKNAWNYLYGMVVQSNRSLARLERFRETVKDDPFFIEMYYSTYKAELRAVRAFMYYYLLDLFGRVPIVKDEEVRLSDVGQSRRSEVFGFVRTELEEILPDLPYERSNTPGDTRSNCYGHITRPVAFMILAKLYLNADVWMDDDWMDESVPGHPDCYRRVLDYCDSITHFGPRAYGLTKVYTDNFCSVNDNSEENILTIPTDPTFYQAEFHYLFRSLHYDHAAALGMSGENGPCATLTVLEANHYDREDEDPRLRLNYWCGYALDNTGLPVLTPSGEMLEYKPLSVKLDLSGDPDEKVAGARMRKYGIDANIRKDGKRVKNDIVIFRYADVLLMRAEAMIRLGQDGKTLVNLVRNRVEAPERETVTLDDVLEERLIELCWEGHRRQDLIRFGRFGRARDIVFPIPADVLAVNSRLTQNPGYDD